MPYVLDLVRLATSIQLAPDRNINNRQAADTLLRVIGRDWMIHSRRCCSKARPGCGLTPNPARASRRNSGIKSPNIGNSCRRRTLPKR